MKIKRTGIVTSASIKNNETEISLFNLVEQSASNIVVNGKHSFTTGAIYSVVYDSALDNLESAKYLGIPMGKEHERLMLLSEDSIVHELTDEIIQALQDHSNNMFSEEHLLYALERVDFDKYL